ncbi:MAG: phage major capsid protein [Butyricicoccaceae bacterium]
MPPADLFSVENVSFLSGTRVVDTQPTKGFTKMSEMETIPNDDKPVFAKLSYKVEDYGLFLPVSNDLLRDTDEALLAYISRWMAKKQVITENNLLVTKLAALDAAATAATAANVIATLKKLLNVSLDPAISATAHFIVNQDGLQRARPAARRQQAPAAAAGSVRRCRQDAVRPSGLRRFNGTLASVTSETSSPSTTTPIYFGDFTQYATPVPPSADGDRVY